MSGLEGQVKGRVDEKCAIEGMTGWRCGSLDISTVSGRFKLIKKSTWAPIRFRVRMFHCDLLVEILLFSHTKHSP